MSTTGAPGVRGSAIRRTGRQRINGRDRQSPGQYPEYVDDYEGYHPDDPEPEPVGAEEFQGEEQWEEVPRREPFPTTQRTTAGPQAIRDQEPPIARRSPTLTAPKTTARRTEHTTTATRSRCKKEQKPCLREGWSMVDHEFITRGLWAQLTGVERGVHASLQAHMDERRQCFPGYEHLAVELGHHPVSIHAAVQRLEVLGFIEVTRARGRAHNYAVRRAKEVWRAQKRTAKS